MTEQIGEIDWTILNTTNYTVKKKQSSCRVHWAAEMEGQGAERDPLSSIQIKGSSGVGPSQMAHLCQEPGSSITIDTAADTPLDTESDNAESKPQPSGDCKLQFQPDAIAVLSSWSCEMHWESTSSPGFSAWPGQWFAGCPWKSQLSSAALDFSVVQSRAVLKHN